jgi:hypothetical protein
LHRFFLTLAPVFPDNPCVFEKVVLQGSILVRLIILWLFFDPLAENRRTHQSKKVSRNDGDSSTEDSTFVSSSSSPELGAPKRAISESRRAGVGRWNNRLGAPLVSGSGRTSWRANASDD